MLKLSLGTKLEKFECQIENRHTPGQSQILFNKYKIHIPLILKFTISWGA